MPNDLPEVAVILDDDGEVSAAYPLSDSGISKGKRFDSEVFDLRRVLGSERFEKQERKMQEHLAAERKKLQDRYDAMSVGDPKAKAAKERVNDQIRAIGKIIEGGDSPAWDNYVARYYKMRGEEDEIVEGIKARIKKMTSILNRYDIKYSGEHWYEDVLSAISKAQFKVKALKTASKYGCFSEWLNSYKKSCEDRLKGVSSPGGAIIFLKNGQRVFIPGYAGDTVEVMEEAFETLGKYF